MVDCFTAGYPAYFDTLTSEELTAAHRLAADKYSQKDWIDRFQ
jgi:hypothetical protein